MHTPANTRSRKTALCVESTARHFPRRREQAARRSSRSGMMRETSAELAETLGTRSRRQKRQADARPQARDSDSQTQSETASMVASSGLPRGHASLRGARYGRWVAVASPRGSAALGGRVDVEWRPAAGLRLDATWSRRRRPRLPSREPTCRRACACTKAPS